MLVPPGPISVFVTLWWHYVAMTFTRRGAVVRRLEYAGATDGGPPAAGDGAFTPGQWVEAPEGIYICAVAGVPGKWGLLGAAGTAKVITAVGDAFAPTGRTVLANNTSGSSKTLSSTPMVTDGVDGQLLTILNVGADNIVVSDQGTVADSGLRLGAATRTLGTRDSLTLMYSVDIGDWVEVGFTNVT